MPLFKKKTENVDLWSKDLPNLGLSSLVELTVPSGMMTSVQPSAFVRNLCGWDRVQMARLLSLRLSSCFSVHGDRSDKACDLWWPGRRWWVEGRTAVAPVLGGCCTGAAPARPGPATTLIKWTASTVTSNCCIYLGQTRPYWHKSTSSWAPWKLWKQKRCEAWRKFLTEVTRRKLVSSKPLQCNATSVIHVNPECWSDAQLL